MESTIKQTELVENLEKEVVLLNTMFKDLDHIVKQQGEQLNTLEDSIITSKEDVFIANKDIVLANGFSSSLTSFKASIIGVGLGSIIYVYNPYLAIGSMILGGYVGYSLG